MVVYSCWALLAGRRSARQRRRFNLFRQSVAGVERVLRFGVLGHMHDTSADVDLLLCAVDMVCLTLIRSDGRDGHLLGPLS